MELLQAMRLFSRLAELQSFTKAAEALQMSRPKVTVAIGELESTLGVRLFQRTTRSVSLTPAGEAFLARADEILARVSDATTMFGASGGAASGRLRIDVPAAFAVQPFMRHLGAFRQAHPGVVLALGVSDRSIDLVAEGVDCAIRIGELQNSSLVGRRLGAIRMLTCAAPAYLEAHGTPASPPELEQHLAINFQSGISHRVLPWQFTENGAESSVVCASSILVDDSTAYVQCALAGFGIVQVPGLLVDKYLRDGSLVEVLSSYRPLPKPVSILYPSRTFVAPQIRAFIEWLQLTFVSMDPAWLE
ncbi:MAG: LysR substrate-binding domain-containing protein [Luteibacter sp.]